MYTCVYIYIYVYTCLTTLTPCCLYKNDATAPSWLLACTFTLFDNIARTKEMGPPAFVIEHFFTHKAESWRSGSGSYGFRCL